MKPVCVPCRRFYRVKQNGVAFVEGMQADRDAKPGLAEPEKWKPYKLWMADLYECRGCGAQILSGFGLRPIAEHYEPDFAAQVKSEQPILQVNDC